MALDKAERSADFTDTQRHLFLRQAKVAVWQSMEKERKELGTKMDVNATGKAFLRWVEGMWQQD